MRCQLIWVRQVVSAPEIWFRVKVLIGSSEAGFCQVASLAPPPGLLSAASSTAEWVNSCTSHMGQRARFSNDRSVKCHRHAALRGAANDLGVQESGIPENGQPSDWLTSALSPHTFEAGQGEMQLNIGNDCGPKPMWCPKAACLVHCSGLLYSFRTSLLEKAAMAARGSSTLSRRAPLTLDSIDGYNRNASVQGQGHLAC